MRHWPEALLLSLVAFIAPIQATMIATGFLLFVDTFTGIWRSRVQRQRITSYKLGNLVAKLILYNTAIVTAFIMQQYLVPLVPMVSLVSTAISAREGLSIFENISLITGTDFVTFLIDKLNPRKETPKHDENE